MGDIGPVEYVVIAFPGSRFKGEIVPAIAELEDNGIVHILGGERVPHEIVQGALAADQPVE